ncbi:MAG: immunity 17 family protein [Cyanobacteria bacterium P01_A01_bin.68]
MENKIICIFIILMGVFSVAASIFNWDWFFNHPRVRMIVKIVGRQDARLLYKVLGLFQIGLGVFILLRN